MRTVKTSADLAHLSATKGLPVTRPDGSTMNAAGLRLPAPTKRGALEEATGSKQLRELATAMRDLAGQIEQIQQQSTGTTDALIGVLKDVLTNLQGVKSSVASKPKTPFRVRITKRDSAGAITEFKVIPE